MKVKLTEKGRNFLNWSPDRQIANVSDNRAFAWMQAGYAVEDKSFMAKYDGPVEEKKPEKPKKEKAVSRKTKNREKAITED